MHISAPPISAVTSMPILAITFMPSPSDRIPSCSAQVSCHPPALVNCQLLADVSGHLPAQYQISHACPCQVPHSLSSSCQLSPPCPAHVSCHLHTQLMSAVTSMSSSCQLSPPCPAHVSCYLHAQLMSAVTSLPIPCQLSLSCSCRPPPSCPAHVSWSPTLLGANQATKNNFPDRLQT